MKQVAFVAFATAWIAGVVLAKGFWSTLIAGVWPFWAWYLVIERIMIHNNWI
jgi:hypothetical protein